MASEFDALFDPTPEEELPKTGVLAYLTEFDLTPRAQENRGAAETYYGTPNTQPGFVAQGDPNSMQGDVFQQLLQSYKPVPLGTGMGRSTLEPELADDIHNREIEKEEEGEYLDSMEDLANQTYQDQLEQYLGQQRQRVPSTVDVEIDGHLWEVPTSWEGADDDVLEFANSGMPPDQWPDEVHQQIQQHALDMLKQGLDPFGNPIDEDEMPFSEPTPLPGTTSNTPAGTGPEPDNYGPGWQFQRALHAAGQKIPESVKWFANEIRQGVLSDESIAAIKNDPASIEALGAYLNVGIALSRGAGKGEKLNWNVVPSKEWGNWKTIQEPMVGNKGEVVKPLIRQDPAGNFYEYQGSHIKEHEGVQDYHAIVKPVEDPGRGGKYIGVDEVNKQYQEKLTWDQLTPEQKKMITDKAMGKSAEPLPGEPGSQEHFGEWIADKDFPNAEAADKAYWADVAKEAKALDQAWLDNLQKKIPDFEVQPGGGLKPAHPEEPPLTPKEKAEKEYWEKQEGSPEWLDKHKPGWDKKWEDLHKMNPEDFTFERQKPPPDEPPMSPKEIHQLEGYTPEEIKHLERWLEDPNYKLPPELHKKITGEEYPEEPDYNIGNRFKWTPPPD